MHGHPGGPGNPHGSKVAQLRAVLIKQLTASDCEQMQDIWAAMTTKAKGGDVHAARLISEYSIGRPRQDISIQADSDLPVKLLPEGVWGAL